MAGGCIVTLFASCSMFTCLSWRSWPWEMPAQLHWLVPHHQSSRYLRPEKMCFQLETVNWFWLGFWSALSKFEVLTSYISLHFRKGFWNSLFGHGKDVCWRIKLTNTHLNISPTWTATLSRYMFSFHPCQIPNAHCLCAPVCLGQPVMQHNKHQPNQ